MISPIDPYQGVYEGKSQQKMILRDLFGIPDLVILSKKHIKDVHYRTDHLIQISCSFDDTC